MTSTWTIEQKTMKVIRLVAELEVLLRENPSLAQQDWRAKTARYHLADLRKMIALQRQAIRLRRAHLHDPVT